MIGKVELKNLPDECPNCGKTLERPVKAVERFADDPAKMMAGLALEAEVEALQGRHLPSTLVASIPVFSQNGMSWTREQAAAHVRGRMEHDIGTVTLAPTTSEDYAKALDLMRKHMGTGGAEIVLLDEDEYIYQTNDGINGLSHKMYLLVFEPVEN
jgi:hypothetical protein